MRKVCPNCFNFVNIKKGENCPICHHEFKSKKEKSELTTSLTPEPEKDNKEGISKNLESLYAEAQKNEAGRELETPVEEKSETKPKDMYHQKNGRVKWVSKRVREGKVKAPKYVANPRVGGVHLNVNSYFGSSRSKYIPDDEKFIIKENGKYTISKLKWWEIYKWADRQLAKNKINKIVKKESVKRPERVSFWVLLSLCLFSGFLGVHNFYAKNIKKGLVSAICFTVAFVFVAFLNRFTFFSTYLQGLLCALPGLISILIWLTDFVAIIFKRFKFNESKINYIKSLDLETRARINKKYIYIV